MSSRFPTFARIWHALVPPRNARPDADLSGLDAYRPSSITRSLPKKWRGPRRDRPVGPQSLSRAHQRELRDVLDQLASMAELNIPFPRALKACAYEQYRRYNTGMFSLRRVTILVFVALVLIFLVLQAVALFGDGELMESEGVLLFGPALVIVGVVWLGIARVWYGLSLGLERVYWTMSRRLDAGMSLSETMDSLPGFFPASTILRVKAAEKAGTVPHTLRSLYEVYAERLALRFGQTYSWARGFAGSQLLGEALVVLAIFLFWGLRIAPFFAELSGEFDDAVDAATWTWGTFGIASFRYILTVTGGLARFAAPLQDPVIAFVPILVLVVGGILIVFALHRMYGVVRPLVRRAFLPVPYIGGIVAAQNTGNIASVLGLVLQAGGNFDEAVATAQSPVHLAPYRRMLDQLALKVAGGTPIPQAFAECHGRFAPLPKGFVARLQLAEGSGDIPDVLCDLGEQAQALAEYRGRMVQQWLGPAAIAILGFVTLMITSASFALIGGIAYGLAESV